MRTTLTLDDDLALRLKRRAALRGGSFKRVVNDTLRRGLTGPAPSRGEPHGFQVHTFRSAFRPGVDLDRLNQLLDDLEVREKGGA